MLKKRIIPTLLIKNMGLVKDIGFISKRRVGSVLPQVKIYNLRDVDELIIMNITATNENQDVDILEVEEFCRHNFVPLTIGGGINNLDQISKLLSVGADKVSLNSTLYNDFDFVKNAINIFGAQCIIASVDYKKENQQRVCYSHSGKKKEGEKLEDWIYKLDDIGIGEILLTCISADGSMNGYDIELIKQISQKISSPLIVSGGAGNYKDMLECFHAGADAVCAASIFHFTELTPAGAKKYLANNGIPVRV